MTHRQPRKLTVKAVWDPEARVWVASSEDVPGLATEADSCEALYQKLLVLVPELLEANGAPPSLTKVPFELLTQRSEKIQLWT